MARAKHSAKRDAPKRIPLRGGLYAVVGKAGLILVWAYRKIVASR